MVNIELRNTANIHYPLRKAGDKRLQLFRWPADDNADLIDLPVRQTVIVELNAAENAAELSAYNLNPPEILLLNLDGSERTRIDGRLPTLVPSWTLKKALTGDDAVQRAERNLEIKFNLTLGSQ